MALPHMQRPRPQQAAATHQPSAHPTRFDSARRCSRPPLRAMNRAPSTTEVELPAVAELGFDGGNLGALFDPTALPRASVVFSASGPAPRCPADEPDLVAAARAELKRGRSERPSRCGRRRTER